MVVALRGNLRDFGISEVFQLIGQQHKTGILEVEAPSEKLRLGFLEGAVVWAAPAGPHEHTALGDMLVRVGLLTPDRLMQLEQRLHQEEETLERLLVQECDLDEGQIESINELVTSETIFTLLRLNQGSFHFSAGKIPLDREPSKLLPAEQILMDGLRMVDEWRALDEAVTRDSTVFQRVGRFETYREVAGEDTPEELALAEKLFLLIDGRLTVRRIIDLSRLGTFEGCRILSRLRERELIEPIEAEVLATTHRRRRAREFAPTRMGLDLATAVLPFAFLFLMAWLALGGSGPVSPEGPTSLDRDPQRRAEVAFETRRLRNLVEAYRFATGDWPRELEELQARGWLPPGALAAAGEHPYYYVRRGDAALVLAPEQ
jgi:hypothetical protein